MEFQKRYYCEDCEDVFNEKHGNPIEKGKHTYIVCPNCHSSNLNEVSLETPITLFYEIGDILSIGVKVETRNATEQDFEEKVWCLYGEDFGEINSYYLTLREAIKMAYASIYDNEFQANQLIIAKGK